MHVGRRSAALLASRDRVYTADESSNTVSVTEPGANEVLGTIPLGQVVFSPTAGWRS